MATEAEVLDACNRREDNVFLDEALAALTAMYSGTGEITLLIQRDGQTFNATNLRGKLVAGSAEQATAFAAIETAVETLIGATDATAGSLRKAVKDLIDANDADIAAT